MIARGDVESGIVDGHKNGPHRGDTHLAAGNQGRGMRQGKAHYSDHEPSYGAPGNDLAKLQVVRALIGVLHECPDQ